MNNFEIYMQWTTIQDIVGPAVKLPHKIRRNKRTETLWQYSFVCACAGTTSYVQISQVSEWSWLPTLYVHRCCMVYLNITKISWKGIAPRGAVPRYFLEHNYTYKTYMQYKIFKFSYISIENGLTWLMTWMFTTTNNL